MQSVICSRLSVVIVAAVLGMAVEGEGAPPPSTQDLSNQIKAVQASVNTVQSSVNALDTKVDGLQSEVGQIPGAWSQTLPAAERFVLVLNNNAAVLDKETGLVWEQSPDTHSSDWASASLRCNDLATGGRKGWRVPAMQELASLVDPSVHTGAALPQGHPFGSTVQVSAFGYWSANTTAEEPNNAWVQRFDSGGVDDIVVKTAGDRFVWCVRGHGGTDVQ